VVLADRMPIVADLAAADPARWGEFETFLAELGHLGRRDEAKPYISKLLALETDFTVERFGLHSPQTGQRPTALHERLAARWHTSALDRSSARPGREMRR
jgi:hypothetical protein